MEKSKYDLYSDEYKVILPRILQTTNSRESLKNKLSKKICYTYVELL